MLNYVLHAYGMDLMLAEFMVKDLEQDQMCTQPHGLVNHPAWTLGHLVVSGHEICELIDLAVDLPAGGADRIKAGSPPSSDSAKYLSKDELMEQHRAFHAQIGDALPNVADSMLARPNPNENMGKYFPTVGDQVIFMVTAHEMDHMGQLAAWRRAMGLRPAL